MFIYYFLSYYIFNFFHICRVFAESYPNLIRVTESAESQANRVFAEFESDYTAQKSLYLYKERRLKP